MTLFGLEQRDKCRAPIFCARFDAARCKWHSVFGVIDRLVFDGHFEQAVGIGGVDLWKQQCRCES